MSKSRHYQELNPTESDWQHLKSLEDCLFLTLGAWWSLTKILMIRRSLKAKTVSQGADLSPSLSSSTHFLKNKMKHSSKWITKKRLLWRQNTMIAHQTRDRPSLLNLLSYRSTRPSERTLMEGEWQANRILHSTHHSDNSREGKWFLSLRATLAYWVRQRTIGALPQLIILIAIIQSSRESHRQATIPLVN